MNAWAIGADTTMMPVKSRACMGSGKAGLRGILGVVRRVPSAPEVRIERIPIPLAETSQGLLGL